MFIHHPMSSNDDGYSKRVGRGGKNLRTPRGGKDWKKFWKWIQEAPPPKPAAPSREEDPGLLAQLLAKEQASRAEERQVRNRRMVFFEICQDSYLIIYIVVTLEVSVMWKILRHYFILL